MQYARRVSKFIAHGALNGHAVRMTPHNAHAHQFIEGHVLGCGSKLEGTYINATGQVAIEFKSGRAYLTMGVVTSPADYEVKGDKIIIKENKDDKEPIVLTRNGDGSIETPFGRMTKKRS